MRTAKRISSSLLLSLLFVSLVWSQRELSTVEAKDHVGEQGTVCGRVASTICGNDSRQADISVEL
jgi:hypothetical protein